MPKVALPTTPTVDVAAKAWTKGFAAAVRDAAGDSERLTPKKAAAMTGHYADNARNYFEKTGRTWAAADTVIDSGARYVRAQLDKAAGPDDKLSLAELRSLPDDLSGDLLALRGKAPAAPTGNAPSLANLVPVIKAANHPELNDYGSSFDVTTYPASATRLDILRDLVGYDDLSEAEVNDWFSSTHGAQAVKDASSALRELGKDERTQRDEDPTGALSGAAAEALFVAVADKLDAVFAPASKVKSLEYAEHFIAEDGDTEHRALIAQLKDQSWLVVSYQDFPF